MTLKADESDPTATLGGSSPGGDGNEHSQPGLLAAMTQCADDPSILGNGATEPNDTAPTSISSQYRHRSNSNGSTCGAFYSNSAPAAWTSMDNRYSHHPEPSSMPHTAPFPNQSSSFAEYAPSYSNSTMHALPHQHEFFPMHGHPLQQHPSHMTAPYNNSLPEYPPPPMQSHSQSQAWMARDEQGGVIGGGWPPQEPNPWWDNSLCYSQSNSRLENFVSYGSVATNAGGSNGGSGMIGPNASTTAVTSATTMNDTRWTSRSVSRAVAADDTFRKKSRRDLRVDVESFASMVHDAALDSPSHHDTSSLPKPFVTPKQSQANNTDSSSREHNLPNRVTSADTGDYTPFSNASDETDVSGDVFDSVRNASFFTECSMFDLPDCLTKTNAMEDDVLQQPRQQCDLLPVGSFIRHYFYNPDSPEFTSLQQFDWAVVLGIAMGFFTAYWKVFIDYGVDLVWVTLPNQLLEWGVFTEPNGWFPLHHYMWITPAIFGGILSCLFVLLQCPDQNQWIHSVHARGIQQHDAFGVLFLLSTAGMWSGMSLGPELPLVLLGGMVGSRLAMATQQSVLQARILNLTAASAAVSGFFGFPMAGALFVLELPHRMGLQYFEALSPATVASIVSVLANRLVTGNDVTGYYRYPWLQTTLPSSIFTYAIVYGSYGCVIGTLYVHVIRRFKSIVHHGFHVTENHLPTVHQEAAEVPSGGDESTPLVSSTRATKTWSWHGIPACLSFGIEHEPTRAACAGALAGAACGLIGMVLPHTMFWGEAQLQNLIDKGRTPLPVFGSSSSLTTYARCMIDPADAEAVREGFGIECSAAIALAKTVMIGLSLGTGIVGGQFWGPLFVGCAASHLFTDAVEYFGFGRELAAHPCVVILCTMAAAHVVTFRAHLGIMLILTLTISSFDPESDSTASSTTGDYSAVFPLLVIAVFVSLMASRDTIVYGAQRSRGDITAVPEVLCRPGMDGSPLVVDYDRFINQSSSEDSDHPSVGFGQEETAEQFAGEADKNVASIFQPPVAVTVLDSGKALSSERLDEILGILQSQDTVSPTHQRTHSAPSNGQGDPLKLPTILSKQSTIDQTVEPRSRSNSAGSQKGLLVRVSSFGDIQDLQPSLMEQARHRAASSAVANPKHRRIPSLPTDPKANTRKGRHGRASSLTSDITTSLREPLHIPISRGHVPAK